MDKLHEIIKIKKQKRDKFIFSALMIVKKLIILLSLPLLVDKGDRISS